MPSLRLALVLILQENLHSCIMDVKTVFLNRDLDDVVYMSQPQSYDDGKGRVCKLNKSVYGLEQTPRQWFHKFQQSEIQAVYFQFHVFSFGKIKR
ncbi:hypothetical protein AVEN_248401-1 [Araneus ventricosus]|uniref:Reverse transcriptase Ty1/copia-type domain-containing protein n=1 Tax=Araneus ventricosus TaxID=182803 RepID=A0A4Y2L9E7_ARAVE|nr:hypothetical protein AVEN_248401-1 [Araneus ventricosus]